MNLMERLAEYAEPVTRHPFILRVRRNHGLEHATIHILNGRNYKLSGRSSEGGFILLGGAPTEQVESAVIEALERMKAGERKLAIHPNCGTNLVTTGFLAAAVAFLGFAGRGLRKSWERFPTMMVAMMAVVLLSMPLGMSLQRHFTTEGDLGDMELVSVTRERKTVPFSGQRVTLHRIVTRQS
ncbi:MAG: DUF6391 domain-containing protein [Chloroflexi bacterium]|nr:DUF6391 domain-containing protein [Chloroflexota bacterium]